MAMSHAAREWTLEELHRLPEDGNRYELVFGELFVTPAPNEAHETVAARLTRILDPFVAEHRLGAVYHPRAVIQHAGSEVEPDLMVRAERMLRKGSWVGAPIPVLVVEIQSDVTRRRDHVQKRRFYLEAGVAEYWIVDTEAEQVRVIGLDGRDDVRRGELTWSPAAAAVTLTIDLEALFAANS
jgi:Uma2 family endonuclease